MVEGTIITTIIRNLLLALPVRQNHRNIEKSDDVKQSLVELMAGTLGG